MIILELNRDAHYGEIRMRRGVPYVIADALAKMISDSNRAAITRFDKFDDYYKPYKGEDLNGKKLIVWRTGGFGDLLFVSSLVHKLKQKYPQATINVATSERFHDIWKDNEDIGRLTSPMVLPLSMNTIMSHDYHLKFEGTIEADTDPDQLPAVDRFSQLAGIDLVGLERLPYYPGAMEYFKTARNVVNKGMNIGLKPMEYACIQFKSSSIVRDWDYIRMIELADAISEKYDIYTLFLGNGFYHPEIESAIINFEDKVGRKVHPKVRSVTEMWSEARQKQMRFLYASALVAKAKFVVTIDSAIVHVAAATFTPSVSLYGPFPGKIRTKYYPRNITLEHPGTCEPFPNGCLQHTQSGPNNILPTQSHCGDSELKVCRMMDSISLQEVMDSIAKIEEQWGTETWQDRDKLFREREKYFEF